MNKYFLERYNTDDDVLVICYENYIREKKNWIAKICSFLDIDLQSKYLENLDLPTGYVSGTVNIDFDDYSFLKPFAYDYMTMLKQHNVSTEFNIDQILMKYEDSTLKKRLDIESQGKGTVFLRTKLDLFVKEKERENLAFRNTIQSLKKKPAAKDKVIDQQRTELMAKERVIQSLVLYRNFSVLYWFGVCLNRPLFGLRKTKTIGALEWILVEFFSAEHSEHMLYQHDPVPLKFSKDFHTVLPNADREAPLVSIVTPSFNQGAFIERTLKSVFNQRYPNLEYIIQDGGSRDNTLQIVEKYRSQFKHVASKKDQGQAQAINLGFRHASGDIMAWLNSDDLFLPGTIAYVVNYFSHHPEVDVVYGHRVNIDEQDNEVGCRVMPPHNEEILKWVDYIPQETLFWRKSIWEKVGGQLDESFRFALDWDLLLRFQKAGANIVRLPRFLGAFRVHAAQKTSSWHEIGRQEVNSLRKKIHGREVSEMDVQRHIKAYVRRLAWYKLMYRFKLIRH